MKALGLVGRLPFYYGWVVVAVAFVTMAVGVNSRTAFSLLFPPILDEFGWERGVTAAAFSVGFLASIVLAPLVGFFIDRYGPRVALPFGATSVGVGFLLAPYISTPFGLYLTLGVLVVGGSIFVSYIGHSAFLPNWFVRRRGLAIGIAFSGVGIGSIVIFPWIQRYIADVGWREACVALGILCVVTIVPLNALLQRRRPQDLGLEPDGDSADLSAEVGTARRAANVVDRDWVAVEWTLGRALRTRRYWWCFFGYMSALYAWYAVQVHQTRYLVDIAFSAEAAALALGLVGFSAIAGQIGIGALSDRIGREWGWTLGCAGFALSYVLLAVLREFPLPGLVYVMAVSQGLLGYGLAPLYSSVAAELFQGPRYGMIFGTLSAASGLGAGAGPWVTGLLFDRTGGYEVAWGVAFALSLFSVLCIWQAGPRQIRAVAGRVGAISRREANEAVAIRLGVGERRQVSADIRGRGGRPLGTSVHYRWEIDRALGEVTAASDDARRAVVHASGSGEGVLRVVAIYGGRELVASRRVEIVGG